MIRRNRSKSDSKKESSIAKRRNSNQGRYNNTFAGKKCDTNDTALYQALKECNEEYLKDEIGKYRNMEMIVD